MLGLRSRKAPMNGKKVVVRYILVNKDILSLRIQNTKMITTLEYKQVPVQRSAKVVIFVASGIVSRMNMISVDKVKDVMIVILTVS